MHTAVRAAVREDASAVILNGVMIEDTFAEAFPMRATRILITADDHALGADRGRVR